MVSAMVTYTVTYLKSLPAPSVRKLLREAGYTLRDVGRSKRPRCSHSIVSRTIRKQVSSEPVWAAIAHCLNHPKVDAVA